MLHPLHDGVYAVGHQSLSMRARYLAAVLACGPRAALSHRSAGGLWGLRANRTWLEVTAPRSRPGPAAITVHRSRMMDPRDFAEIDGIPVTSVARTLLDLAGVLYRWELARAVDRAERLRIFDLTRLEELLLRSRGRRGAGALRAAVAGWHASDTRSELEDRFRDLIAAADLPPPRLNVLVDGERAQHEVDAHWPAYALVVQLDGFAYHRTRRDLERDAETDTDLELGGHRVLRLTWDDVVVRSARTVRRLARAIA